MWAEVEKGGIKMMIEDKRRLTESIENPLVILLLLLARYIPDEEFCEITKNIKETKKEENNG